MISARNSDPYTSHQAAETVNLSRLEGIVLDSLKQSISGRTIDELVAMTGLEKVSISPRLRPLCKMGLVVETTETRPGRAGRCQIVWRAKE